MKVGGWDIDKDGLMSLEGQSTFPCYGADGCITMQTVQYYLVGGNVFAKFTDPSLEELERLYKL